MKRLTLIIGIALTSLVGSAQMVREQGKKTDGIVLPESNKKILDYATKHIGKIIGKKLCFYFVDSALISVNPNWKVGRTKKWGYDYGKEVKFEDALPGDIVLYKNAKFKNGDFVASHIAIVYYGSTEGDFVEIEQNSGINWGAVSINHGQKTPDTLVSGSMVFFRPY